MNRKITRFAFGRKWGEPVAVWFDVVAEAWASAWKATAPKPQAAFFKRFLRVIMLVGVLLAIGQLKSHQEFIRGQQSVTQFDPGRFVSLL